MNIEPCVRLGMRNSQKIKENPPDSRNKRPPNVTLLTVSSSQNVITAALPLCARSALGQWRIIARIDRMREIFLFRPCPELTDILIGFDGFVPELEPIFGAFGANAPNIESPDHVAEVVEFQWAARRIGQTDRPQRAYELLLVARVAACRFQGGIDHLAVDVEQACVLARNRIKILEHAIDEALVGVDLEIERIGNAAHQPNGLFAEALAERVVAAGLSGDHRIFKAGIGVSFHEAQRV